MVFEDILVHLDSHAGYERRLQLAISIARRDKARLVGLYGFEMPRVPFPDLVSEAYVEDNAYRTIYVRERDAAFTRASQMEAAFRAETHRAGLTADWQIAPDKAGDLAGTVIKHAHYADLAVLGQADPDHPLFDKLATLPESVMMGCGRPVLIVPYAGALDAVGKNVLVAWNGTRESARAVGDAMPLLRSADTVTVVSIGPTHDGKAHDHHPAANLAEHLARHEIRAEASHLVSDAIAAGDLILSEAKDRSCDLIVMGGYGHSRTLELILGGVTRTVLRHMTVPVFMSH